MRNAKVSRAWGKVNPWKHRRCAGEVFADLTAENQNGVFPPWRDEVFFFPSVRNWSVYTNLGWVSILCYNSLRLSSWASLRSLLSDWFKCLNPEYLNVDCLGDSESRCLLKGVSKAGLEIISSVSSWDSIEKFFVFDWRSFVLMCLSFYKR